MTDSFTNNVTRRSFLATTMTFAAAGMTPLNGLLANQPAVKPLYSFGIVTDMHYANKDPYRNRYCRESLQKLRSAIQEFRRQNVAAVLQLGDIIDISEQLQQTIECLAEATEAFQKLQRPYHFVMGNHCLDSLTKRQFAEITQSKGNYYSFDHQQTHVVILDACYRWDGQPYADGNYVWNECLIPDEELDWFKEDLANTTFPTIVCTHQRLDVDGKYSVKNHSAVRKVMEKSGKVSLVLQGHKHDGNFSTINGISYCGIRALVEGSGMINNSYSVLSVFADGSLQLKGYAQQKSHDISAKDA